jgi:hypothetical protein
MRSNRPNQPGAPLLGANLLARGLRKKSRTRESSFRCRFVDLINQCFIERDIDAHRSSGIGKQRNSEQHGACFNSRNNIFVAKHVIGGTRRRHGPTCALDCFNMLSESCCRIRHSFVHRLSSRETSLDVREPDAKSAIRFFFDDSDIMHRHPVDTPPRTHRSGPPSGRFVNPPYKPGRQISSRMSHGDDLVSSRMFERVVIAAHPIENPTVLFQHLDQLAAVPFHKAGLQASPKNSLSAGSCARSARTSPARQVRTFPTPRSCVYK